MESKYHIHAIWENSKVRSCRNAAVSTDVPADAQATAENFKQQIIEGTLTLPANIP